jgi:predicted RNase H-like HicB family nuclease
MLTEYVQAALRQAVYEILDDNEGFYGHIPVCPGAWANAPTLEACREELRSVLEDWIVIGLRLGHELPIIDGINLTPPLIPERIDEVPAEAAA